MTNTLQRAVTAAMLAIGDELLSGRTKDKNIGHLADVLTAAGIDLKEVRIVPDDEDAIVTALNALRPGFDYVFTSGGIGPTHDDITADAVSRAFEVPCIYDEKAMEMLAANYAKRELEFTDSRKRMARMPQAPNILITLSRQPPVFISAMSMSWLAYLRYFRRCSIMFCRRLKQGANFCRRLFPARLAKVSLVRRLRRSRRKILKRSLVLIRNSRTVDLAPSWLFGAAMRQKSILL
jgi:molybdenum cofactor synthesis domain-containing protein